MKICPICGKIIKGRTDKIYCDPKCKNVAQYEKRLINEQFYLSVDKQLKTNRRILKEFNKAGKATVRKEVLIGEGFNPKFFTHYWKAKNGNLYLFCYEYGYMSKSENNKEKFVLIQWQEYMGYISLEAMAEDSLSQVLRTCDGYVYQDSVRLFSTDLYS